MAEMCVHVSLSASAFAFASASASASVSVSVSVFCEGTLCWVERSDAKTSLIVSGVRYFHSHAPTCWVALFEWATRRSAYALRSRYTFGRSPCIFFAALAGRMAYSRTWGTRPS